MNANTCAQKRPVILYPARRVSLDSLKSCGPVVEGRGFVAKDYLEKLVEDVRSELKDMFWSHVLPPATTTTLGGVIVGNGLTVDPNGRIDVVFPSHEGYVPLIQDRNGDLSAATVGGRSTEGEDKVGVGSFSSGRGNIASGDHSHAEGDSVIARGLNSHAEGCTTRANGNCSHAEGKYTEASGAYSHAAGYRAKAQQHAYAWSGVESDTVYESNGDGTYNINPVNGVEGFYVGRKNLKTIISEEAPTQDLDPITRHIESLESTQRGFLDGSQKVAVAQGLYHALTGAEVSGVEILDGLDGLDAKRDKTDNIATDDTLVWDVTPPYDAEGRPITVRKTAVDGSDILGFCLYLGDRKIDGRFIPLDTREFTWMAGLDWAGDIDVHAVASVTTKAGEPYVTPTYVKSEVEAVASGKRDKTDNIAAADSEAFTEWEFRSITSGELREGLSLKFVEAENQPPFNGYWELYNSGNILSILDGGSDALRLEDNSSDLVATRIKLMVAKAGDTYVTVAGVQQLVPPPPDLSGYAKTAQLDRVSAVKRDSTDNIAAADSNAFSEWEFSSDDATVLNEMKLNGAKLVYKESNGRRCWVFENCPSRIGDRYDLFFSETPETSEEALYVSHTLYMDQELAGYVEVTARRTVNVITKLGEPYVTPTGVKSLLPSPFHALTPEVADTTVTLKPVDGAANHVDDVVDGFKDSFSGTVDIVVVVMEWNEDADTYIPSDYHYNATVDDVKVVLSPDKTKITMEILRDFDVYGVGFFTKGTVYEETAPRFDGDLWFADFPLGLDEGVDSGIVQVEGRFTTLRSLINVIPADATKARKFTLAVETDTETENAVTWQGGEVIEAVPGASNLVPGLNVWDVAEVAPGKFRVDRASMPAQSVPLTLTAPGGRVAELTVGDDLVLEVKEV